LKGGVYFEVPVFQGVILLFLIQRAGTKGGSSADRLQMSGAAILLRASVTGQGRYNYHRSDVVRGKNIMSKHGQGSIAAQAEKKKKKPKFRANY
jgi:hypothetical protein